MEYKPELLSLKQDLIAMTDTYEQLVTKVTGAKDNEYLDFLARRLVEAATHCVFGYLLLQSAHTDNSFLSSMQVYLRYGKAEMYKIRSFIENFSIEDLKAYRRE